MSKPKPIKPKNYLKKDPDILEIYKGYTLYSTGGSRVTAINSITGRELWDVGYISIEEARREIDSL